MTADGFGTWIFSAADPNHTGNVAFVSTAGNLQFSQNYGSTFYTSARTPSTSFLASRDVAWLVSPFSSEGGPRPPNFGCTNSYAANRIDFDPSDSGRLYLTCATGLSQRHRLMCGRLRLRLIGRSRTRNQQGLQVNDLCRVPSGGDISHKMNNMLFVCQGKSGATQCAAHRPDVYGWWPAVRRRAVLRLL